MYCTMSALRTSCVHAWTEDALIYFLHSFIYKKAGEKVIIFQRVTEGRVICLAAPRYHGNRSEDPARAQSMQIIMLICIKINV